MLGTQKQRGYLASLIDNNKEEYQSLQDIWDGTPKNNEKYPDERCDYREIILADNLAPLTGQEISYIINTLLGRTNQFNKKYSTKIAFNYLYKLKLIN